MLESGNWILPVNYGTDIAYKPPFLYWAIAAISSLFGGVSEYSSRLPSAIAFLAMQLVFFSFIAKRKGVKTAFLTSILLLSSFEVHRAAVACRVDMLQVSLIVISLCLLFRWDEKECRGIPWLAVLLMGCATLTKGPVGSIFPCGLHRSLPVVTWTFFLEDILLVIACRNPFSDSLCSLGGRGLCTRRTVFCRFNVGREYRSFHGKDVLRIT